jgi:trans-aconitate 2-methyltransferase
MKTYEWNAADYTANSAAQFRWASELIEKLNLNGNEAVLDVGCGDGKVTAEIARRLANGSIMGIDSSEDMIRIAKKTHRIDNLSFQLMDIRDLDARDTFDVIFSNATLHWIRDHHSFLPNMFAALKKSGRILLQMGGEGNARDIVATAEKVMSRSEWRRFFHEFQFPYGFHNDTDYRIWLQNTGFVVDRAELIPKDMVQASRPGLAAWIRTTWLPYTQRVPAHLREQFIDQLIDNYQVSFPLDDEGNFHVHMARLEVEAHKE